MLAAPLNSLFLTEISDAAESAGPLPLAPLLLSLSTYFLLSFKPWYFYSFLCSFFLKFLLFRMAAFIAIGVFHPVNMSGCLSFTASSAHSLK